MRKGKQIEELEQNEPKANLHVLELFERPGSPHHTTVFPVKIG